MDFSAYHVTIKH